MFPPEISKNQVQKLESIGINSLYDLITFLPMDFLPIIPFDESGNDPQPRTKYLFQAKLIDVEKRQGSFKPYFYLSLQSDSKRIQAYYFASSSWTMKSLEVGKEFQLLLIHSNGFWQVEKMVLLKNIANTNFALGSANMTQHLLCRYHKRGIFMSQFFEQIHSQLLPHHYFLNLEDLVPDNNLIPKVLNLNLIHHPQSSSEYQQGMKDWVAFKVFLKISLVQYLESEKEQKMARAGVLDSDFLNSMISRLPFELSESQFSTTNDVLREIMM
jgi:RecG-like helicase